MPHNPGVHATCVLWLTGQAPLHHLQVPSEPCPTTAQAPWSHRLSSLVTCPAIGSMWARSPKLARARPTRHDGAARTIFDWRVSILFFHAHLHERWAWRLQGLEIICCDVNSSKKKKITAYIKYPDPQSFNPSQFVSESLLDIETRELCAKNCEPETACSLCLAYLRSW